MNEKNLKIVCVVLAILLIVSTVAGMIYRYKVNLQKEKTANRLSFAAYNNIQNAINMTVTYHKQGNTSEEYRYRINYIMLPAIANLRSADRLYEEAGEDYYGNLDENIPALKKLREYIMDHWGNKSQILPVLDSLDPLLVPHTTPLKAISNKPEYFNGDYQDFSDDIEEALEDGR